jgi:hypothetical protein
MANLSNQREMWAQYILTLVNALEKRSFFNALERHSQVHLNKDQVQGLLLSSSGSRGQRTYVLHDWERIIQRSREGDLPDVPSASFYSLFHAAGIECFLTHYFKDHNLGIYDPSVAPLKALEFLCAQNSQALFLTPSTFLRFISYPRLAEWIQKNISFISFGGENVSSALNEILRTKYAHINCRSVFGTSETMSIKTKTGKDLNWHIPVDPDIQINTDSTKMIISTPYLFTHHLVDGQFIAQKNQPWETGDEIEWDKGEFRIIRSRHLKYHGLKIFPEEWEKFLISQFQLPWIQILLESDEVLCGIIPMEFQNLIPEIRDVCTKNSWPVMKWSVAPYLKTSERGKKVMKSEDDK